MENERIDKLQSILVALEMINDLTSSKSTREDIQATRDYIYSLENIIPFGIILELYRLVANIKIYKHHLDRKFK